MRSPIYFSAMPSNKVVTYPTNLNLLVYIELYDLYASERLNCHTAYDNVTKTQVTRKMNKTQYLKLLIVPCFAQILLGTFSIFFYFTQKIFRADATIRTSSHITTFGSVKRTCATFKIFVG